MIRIVLLGNVCACAGAAMTVIKAISHAFTWRMPMTTILLRRRAVRADDGPRAVEGASPSRSKGKRLPDFANLKTSRMIDRVASAARTVLLCSDGGAWDWF